MSDLVSQVNNRSLKSIQSWQQSNLPSSFSVNPEYFNQRIIRIKQKIDSLIRQFLPSDEKSTSNQVKTEFIAEDKSGLQTARTHYNSLKLQREQIAAQKLVGDTRQRVKNIYNELHQLEMIAVKDQNLIDTHTFELKSFLKDLRNQNKRLIRIIPGKILHELETQKKMPFKKSVFQPKQQLDPFQEMKQFTQQYDHKALELQQKLINEQVRKRKIFADPEKLYEDKKGSKCKLLQCKLI